MQKDELEAGLTGEKKTGEDVVIEKSNVLMMYVRLLAGFIVSAFGVELISVADRPVRAKH